MNEVYVSRFRSWAPEMENIKDWESWARGEKNILQEKKSPELSFTEPMFRRRLSQISKMTIQVLYDLQPFREDSKIVFVSFRGELNQQLKINSMLIEEQTVMPASFSLSVFNTPVALATIALNLRSGYTAIYPSEDNFYDGFSSAVAPLAASDTEEIIFVYADEFVPEEYQSIIQGTRNPLAFAAILSRKQNGIPISTKSDSDYFKSPEDFLKYLYARGGHEF
jgi:hypothetical protein